jgi:membrane-associated phospholipid phosphatase
LLALLTVGSFLLDGSVYEFTHRHFNYFMRPVPSSHKLATRVLRSMEDWGENVFIVAVAIAMWRLDRRNRSRVLCIGLASLVVALAVEGVKRVTGRERPNISQGRIAFRGPIVWLTGEYGPPPDPAWKPSAGDYQSFPSGHTASAGVYSGTLAAFYPPLRPVCIALAVGCGANRIWKERHYLSDCWIGGAFGYWIATILPRRRMVQPLRHWFDRRFSVAD